MNIYIYGTKTFQNTVNSILTQTNIDENIEVIKSLKRLKETIKNTPDEFFIIDSERIYQENFFTKRFSFFIPKDNIKKSFLEQYGLDDIYFNSVEGMVIYLQKRLELLNDKKNVHKNLNEIKNIDDIEDFQIQEVVSELTIKN